MMNFSYEFIMKWNMFGRMLEYEELLKQIKMEWN